MLLAGSVDLADTLRALAQLRPVFHSEADFQLALAWQVQQRDPAMLVRLETRPAPGVHLDLSFARPDLVRSTAVELKYLTRAWQGEIRGERYDLKNHGAQDIRGYDVVKDIVRVERFIAEQDGADGAVVVLANDASYWRAAKSGDVSNAAAFRLGHGVQLEGARVWGPKTGAGTMKGRSSPLELSGSYEMTWQPYSTLPDGGPGAKFQQLVIEISTRA